MPTSIHTYHIPTHVVRVENDRPRNLSQFSMLTFSLNTYQDGHPRYAPVVFPDIPEELLTLTHVVDSSEVGRPDIIAKKYYLNQTAMWIVCRCNNIEDPFTEIVAGMELKLPTLSALHESILRR